MFAKLLEIFGEFIIRMRTANHHQRRAGIPDLNLLTHPALLFPGLTFRRVVHHFQHRRIDHAQHRFALLNQRDIDREFAIALDELFGAVERIDQPVALPVLAHFPGGRIFF